MIHAMVVAGAVFYGVHAILYESSLAEIRDFRQRPKHYIGTSETMNLSNVDYTDHDADLLKWPRVIEMSPDHSMYVSGLVEEIISVILEERVLEEKSARFGKGTFFFEKDPRKPSKRSLTFGPENFPFRSIQISFNRPGKDQPWNHAIMSVHPRNFPIGVFEMNLAKSWFGNWDLQNTSLEKRENSSVKQVNTYCYHITKSTPPLTVKFSSRPDVSDLTHGYPRSFHLVTVERKLC